MNGRCLKCVIYDWKYRMLKGEINLVRNVIDLINEDVDDERNVN